MSKVGKRAAKLHLLTARKVLNAVDGDHGDGGGLYLRVRGADGSAAWVLRYTAPTGRRREMDLCACHGANAQQAGAALTSARDLAHRCREQLRAGTDPIAAREGHREGERKAEVERKADRARERWTLADAPVHFVLAEDVGGLVFDAGAVEEVVVAPVAQQRVSRSPS